MLNRPYRKQKWERNQCGVCGRFKTWKDLTLHFTPDTAFSSESESYRECRACRRKHRPRDGDLGAATGAAGSRLAVTGGSFSERRMA